MKQRLAKYFQADAAVGGVSKVRLYLMRLFFVLMFLTVGRKAWIEIFTHTGQWYPLHGIAYSFWAAYSTLLLLGLRYPLKVVPLLLVQFLYKVVWMLAVVYPLWSSNQLSGTDTGNLASQFIAAIVVDVILIPWASLRSYFQKSSPA